MHIRPREMYDSRRVGILCTGNYQVKQSRSRACLATTVCRATNLIARRAKLPAAFVGCCFTPNRGALVVSGVGLIANAVLISSFNE